MQYLGGKSRLGGRIVGAILNDLGIKRVGIAVDLCAGAGNATCRLADVSDRVVAVEAHPGLVNLMQAVQGGWVPPEHVSAEDYQTARRGDAADPLVTFVGFGCSFSGKWWGGYAKNNRGDNYAQQSSKALRRDARANVEHVASDALTWDCAGAEVVYCDPPYTGTTGYNAVAAVAADAWWHRLAALASEGRACYLSEYAEAPPAGIDARLVWEAPTHKTHLTKGTRTERLWRVLGFVGAANGPATPSEDPPWVLSPFYQSLQRYYRRPDGQGGRIPNPLLDRCDDVLVIEAILRLEGYEDQVTAEVRRIADAEARARAGR